MTNAKDFTASALLGIHHMGVRTDSHTPALHNLFMFAIDLAIASRNGHPQLEYKPREQTTTVTTIHGDVCRIKGDTGHGEYDACDGCERINDIDYLDSDNMCDDCVEAELSAMDDDLPDDTPSLDTSFHDHEMAC